MTGLGSMGVVPASPVTAFQQGQQATQMEAMRGQQLTAMHLHNLMTLGKLHDSQVEAQAFKTALTQNPPKTPTDLYNDQIKAATVVGQSGDVGGMLKLLDAAQKSRTAQFDQAFKAIQIAQTHAKLVRGTLDQLSAQLPDIKTPEQWQNWNQEVEQATGAPSPFANVPFSPAAVKAAQDMAMSLDHQIKMKEVAATQAHNKMMEQQAQERLQVAQQKLALALKEFPGKVAEERARVKELEAQKTHYEHLNEGIGHGAKPARVLSAEQLYGIDQSLTDKYPGASAADQHAFGTVVNDLTNQGMGPHEAIQQALSYYDPQKGAYAPPAVVKPDAQFTEGAKASASDKTLSESAFKTAAEHYGYKTPEQVAAYKKHLESLGYKVE